MYRIKYHKFKDILITEPLRALDGNFYQVRIFLKDKDYQLDVVKFDDLSIKDSKQFQSISIAKSYARNYLRRELNIELFEEIRNPLEL